MKVLWFTNMMMPEFADLLGETKSVVGGWMPSLADSIRKYAPSIELTIASEGPIQTEKVIGGIKYIALGPAKKRGKVCPWLHRIRPNFIASVRKCVEACKPEVIHIHGSEGLFPGLPNYCWCGIPVAISLQGIIAGYASHYMGNITERELRPFRNIAREILQGYSTANEAEYWRRRRGVMEIAALRDFKYVFGRTFWDKAWAKYINPSIQYFNVGEVLRPEFYCARRKDDEIVPHTIYCGAAATYPLKGAHWVLRAVASLRHKYPDVKLIIARAPLIVKHLGFFQYRRLGEYHRYLRALIDDLGIWENVECLGCLSAKEVVKVLRKSEVFCLPSLVENSPNSIAEAMLIGVPAVATDVGGTKSILADSIEGQLVPSADPAVLASAIDRFFSDKTFARSCSNAAYKAAVRSYAPDLVVQQLMRAYEAIISVEKECSLDV